jgi:hypothetical protein
VASQEKFYNLLSTKYITIVARLHTVLTYIYCPPHETLMDTFYTVAVASDSPLKAGGLRLLQAPVGLALPLGLEFFLAYQLLGPAAIIIEQDGVSALVTASGNNGSLSRVNLQTGAVTSIITDLVLPSDPFSGHLTLEPGRASVLLATSKDIVRVNVATGGATIITDQVCGQSAVDVTGITVEASGDTALLAHRLCGILRVRVR